MFGRGHLYVSLAIAAASVVATPAAAQFYKGKTLTVVIGTRAGGNGDIQGRLVMRHMEKYIPGKPTVVVKNMAGSGGILATNYVAEVAKPDGYTVGYSIINILSELLGEQALRVSHKDLGFIGGLGSTSVYHIRKDTPPGINGVEDVLKIKKTFRTAGHAPTSQKDLGIRLLCSMLQMPCDHVTGFKSAGVIRRAIQQNEIQMTADSVTGYFSRVQPTLIKEGTSVPLWQYGIPVKGGGMRRDPSMPSLPTPLDVYKMKFGKDAMPSGPEWQAYRLIVGTSAIMLRAVFLPPKSPEEPTKVLREAFAKTVADKEFQSEWKKLTKAAPSAAVGEEGAEYIKEVLDVTPQFVTFLKKFVEEGAQ